jgi:hypothetical protein
MIRFLFGLFSITEINEGPRCTFNNFACNEVWEFVKRPSDHNVIGTKWVFRNKQDKNGVIVRNKARLVA